MMKKHTLFHSLLRWARTAMVALCGLAALPGAADDGIQFSSSDARLEATFNWAKRMALSYAHDGSDPVGYWYEAALPSRDAFCMRDVSHQTIGAEMLGLSRHNFNMMSQFATNLDVQKDWCSQWEITKQGLPCPADYVDDANFWYNLNANLDVTFACWRLYEWTGDERYLRDPNLVAFYHYSCGPYIRKWMLEPENIFRRPAALNATPETTARYRVVRGLPSYVESFPGLSHSADLLATLYGGFRAYSQIEKARGNAKAAKSAARMAEAYRQNLDRHWWDDARRAYHTFWTTDGKFADGEGLTYPLWFGAVQQPERIEGTIACMMARKEWNIENVSHFPLLWYRFNRTDEAYRILCDILTMPRKEYPEVSYGMVEGIVSGMMGLTASASQGKVTTLPKLPTPATRAELRQVPMLGGTVALRYDGVSAQTFTNHTGRALTWEASVMGVVKGMSAGGKKLKVKQTKDVTGAVVSSACIPVASGQTVTVKVE